VKGARGKIEEEEKHLQRENIPLAAFARELII